MILIYYQVSIMPMAIALHYKISILLPIQMHENEIPEAVEDVDIDLPSDDEEMNVRQYTLTASYYAREQASRVLMDIERFCPPTSR